ncbi:MAG TPA: hypothetical protein VIZ20_14440 [Streptosporangiaceae bacterium]|jgi:hypothetical protein
MNVKSKALGFTASGALALAAVGTIGASSASAHTVWGYCTHGGHSGICTIMGASEALWSSTNALIRTIPTNDEVEVECWYTGGGPGTPADGIWDHIVWTAHGGSSGTLVQGHMDDNQVDLGGDTPAQLGLPHCG